LNSELKNHKKGKKTKDEDLNRLKKKLEKA